MSRELKCEILPEDAQKFDLSFKIIVLGDCGVGKTCLSMRASRNDFDEHYTTTIGFEFLTINIRVNDSNIKLQIWDTCGQEVYRSLIASFYHSASLAIIVYSIDNENSFNHITEWLNEVKLNSNPDIKLVLIGNKADLEDIRKVKKEEGEKLSIDNNMSFFMETSAKSGFNAENLFIEVGKELYQYYTTIKNNLAKESSIFTEEEKRTVLSSVKGKDRPRKKKCC